MEQSKFILEVQSRQCIWNPRVSSYLDRVLKRQAWEEVAAKMHEGFNSCSDNEKREKVRELQKKWKSLKDFYKRRNPKEDIDQKTKKKKPIVELLQFLDKVTKLDHHIRTQQRLTRTEQIKIKNKNLIFQLPDYKITVQKFNDGHPSKARNTRKRNYRCSKPRTEDENQQNEEMKFLQSLLPVMQSLSDRQRFEFKLQVMMLLKRIKYEEEDAQSNTDVADDKARGRTFIRPAVIEKAPSSMPSLTVIIPKPHREATLSNISQVKSKVALIQTDFILNNSLTNI